MFSAYVFRKRQRMCDILGKIISFLTNYDVSIDLNNYTPHPQSKVVNEW